MHIRGIPYTDVDKLINPFCLHHVRTHTARTHESTSYAASYSHLKKIQGKPTIRRILFAQNAA